MRYNFWWRLVHLDPAIHRGLIMAVVLVLTSFGIHVSDAIPDSLIILLVAVSAMVQALWTKGAVTPNAKVVSYLDDPAKPREISPGDAVTTASDEMVVATARSAGEPDRIGI